MVIFTPSLSMAGNKDAKNAYAMPYSEEELQSFQTTSPIVIELFTSKNCVFCPLADLFLTDLIEKTNVIALSCHVDYYDSRENPLSHKLCSNRQLNYASHLKGTSVFTPQMIVNGKASVVGYKYDEVLVALQQAAKNPPLKIDIIHLPGNKSSEDISLKNPEGEELRVEIPEAFAQSGDKNLKLFVANYEKEKRAKISAKNNSSSMMTYKNVVGEATLHDLSELWSEEVTLEKKNEKNKTITLPAPKKTLGNGVVVLIQNGAGHILAAGHIQWPDTSEYN